MPDVSRAERLTRAADRADDAAHLAAERAGRDWEAAAAAQLRLRCAPAGERADARAAWELADAIARRSRQIAHRLADAAQVARLAAADAAFERALAVEAEAYRALSGCALPTGADSGGRGAPRPAAGAARPMRCPA